MLKNIVKKTKWKHPSQPNVDCTTYETPLGSLTINHRHDGSAYYTWEGALAGVPFAIPILLVAALVLYALTR